MTVHIQCCQLISDSCAFTVSQTGRIFKNVWNAECETLLKKKE